MRNLISVMQIKTAREIFGFTQSRLGAKVRLSQAAISNIECEKELYPSERKKIQQFFERNGLAFHIDGIGVFPSIQTIDSQNSVETENLKKRKPTGKNKFSFSFTKPNKATDDPDKSKT